MIERGQASIAVVDAEGRFAGLISPHAMVSALLAEHDKPWLGWAATWLARGERAGRREEKVTRRLWHRLPWLIVGLAGAMFSVAIVSGFERELNAEVLLAFFLPAVIYMADAVGTQTEAILIRAMSAGRYGPLHLCSRARDGGDPGRPRRNNVPGVCPGHLR